MSFESSFYNQNITNQNKIINFMSGLPDVVSPNISYFTHNFLPSSATIDTLSKFRLSSGSLGFNFFITGSNSGGGSSIQYSSNGSIWNDTTNGLTFAYGIAFNGEIFIALGLEASGNTIFTSRDGIIWFPANNNPFPGQNGNGACWSPELNIFVGVGQAGSSDVSIATSSDGYNWTTSLNNPFSGGASYDVCWSSELSKFVAVGTSMIALSSNGRTWTESSQDPFGPTDPYEYDSICWNGSKFVVVGTNNDSSVSIAISTDGENWTTSTNNPFDGGVGYDVCWSQELSKFVAVGKNADISVTVALSPDGLIWTPSTQNPFQGTGIQYATGIRWNSLLNIFLILGYDPNPGGQCILTSPDGNIWTVAEDQNMSSGISCFSLN